MRLLTFAHWGEAQCFFDYFTQSSPLSGESLYQLDEKTAVFITGEGIYESLTSLSQVFQEFSRKGHSPIKEVINLGVAGALLKTLPLKTAYAIDQVYLWENKFPHPKSFPLKTPADKKHRSLQLLSSLERLQGINQQEHSPLAALADLVDRELWGQAYLCHKLHISLSAIKVVSDFVTDEQNCELVTQASARFSEILLQEYLNLFPQTEGKQTETNSPLESGEDSLLPADFYVTISQERELKKYAELMTEVTPEHLQQIRQEVMRPKDRTKKLLEQLQEKRDPIGSQMRKELEQLLLVWQRKDCHLSFERTLQNPSLKIALEVQDLKHWQRLARDLDRFPWKEWEDYWLQDPESNA
jgi:hypothetical protein